MTAQIKTLPRENLCRSVPFTLTRADETPDEGLTFEGYGAVFNTPTRIDSWEGCFDEQIAPGAFRKSLRERTPKFQFDHGHHPMFGSLPMGTISSITEDERGLLVEAQISDSWFWEPVRSAIASGAVDGMSFRFSVVRDEWRDRDGNLVRAEDVDMILYGRDPEQRGPLMRTLKEVKIAEVGPVVWPAYAGTTASVRSVTIDLATIHTDPEQRRLLAEVALRADAANIAADEAEQSDDEPQDTTEVAVEHSDEDNDAPQPTEAGEHESESLTEDPAPIDEVDAARAADIDRLFTEALNEVKTTRESTPPMKGI